MLRNTRVQMATALAVGALLGWLAASGRLNLFARASAGQLLAPAESSSGAPPACCDEVNKCQLLALANRFSPGGGAAPQPPTPTAPAQASSAPPADQRPEGRSQRGEQLGAGS
jgi:hypothetical protein